MYSVYIIECTSRTGRVTIHVGIALDVERRVAEHRSGLVKATRGRRVRLVGYSSPMEKGEALRMEAFLKKQPPMMKRKVYLCHQTPPNCPASRI